MKILRRKCNFTYLGLAAALAAWYNKSKNIARIRFGAAEYVDNHRNRGGHKNTTLDREQKEALVKSLKKPIEQYKLEDIDTELCKYIHDGWTYLIYMNNSFCGFSDDAMIEAMNSGDIPKKYGTTRLPNAKLFIIIGGFFMFEDDLELVEYFGLSAELTENSNVNTVISNVQYEDYRVSIHICPPVERDDVKYFMIYNVYWPRGEDIYAMKCARISLFEPKYIECIDSTIPNWVLNKDEKKTILKEISRIWRRILYQYEFVLYGFDNKIVKLQGLPMPNYMLLPE